MIELIFTVVVLFPNKMATVTETVLLKLSSQEECRIMREQVAQRLIYDPPKLPSFLECRNARYDKS